jgi:hypothetical protein
LSQLLGMAQHLLLGLRIGQKFAGARNDSAGEGIRESSVPTGGGLGTLLLSA